MTKRVTKPLDQDAGDRSSKSLVVVDADVVNAWRLNRGWSETTFADELHLGQETYRRIKRGDGIQISTARKLADLMGLPDVSRLLTNPPPSNRALTIGEPLIVDEWEAGEPLSDWMTATNGLQYRTYRMRNRYTPTTLARGKCYELNGLYDRERNRVEEYFVRHPDVCRRALGHPNLPVNVRCCPDTTGRWWWVVDQWAAGDWLVNVLSPNKRFDTAVLKSIMRQVADGLNRLHFVGVIRRELSPANILFDAKTQRVVLTDFELGKLTDGRPTVSKEEWPVDPYRAPEVGKSRLDVRADIFSWGRLFVRVATGQLPENGTESRALNAALLPRSIRDFVASCVDVIPRNRPSTMADVLTILDRWK